MSTLRDKPISTPHLDRVLVELGRLLLVVRSRSRRGGLVRLLSLRRSPRRARAPVRALESVPRGDIRGERRGVAVRSCGCGRRGVGSRPVGAVGDARGGSGEGAADGGGDLGAERLPVLAAEPRLELREALLLQGLRREREEGGVRRWTVLGNGKRRKPS